MRRCKPKDWRFARPTEAEAQMLPRDSEGVERRQPSRLVACFHIEFHADATNEFRSAAIRGEHSGQKKQVSRLHCLHVDAERLRWRWKIDAKFL